MTSGLTIRVPPLIASACRWIVAARDRNSLDARVDAERMQEGGDVISHRFHAQMQLACHLRRRTPLLE